MTGDIVVWGGDAVTLDGWSATAAPGSTARLAVDAATLRFDFSLADDRSWAIARRTLLVDLPAHYVVSVRLRGEAPPNVLQVKLVDPSGANVWWWRHPCVPRGDGERIVLRRATLEFAWGPAGGGQPERLGALEVAVAAGRGGSGTLLIDDLRIEPRPPVEGPPRPLHVRASSAAAGEEAEGAVDFDEGTRWRPDPGDPHPWLELDLGQPREWGGLVVDFPGPAPPCRLLDSNDGTSWTLLVEDPGGPDSHRWLRAGAAESRFIRLELPAGDGGGIARVMVVPIELTTAPARWAAWRAGAAPRGCFPRHLLGEQAYWAVVGGDGDERKALLGEDGALEVAAEAFTVEPFLWADGRLLTWADVETSTSLAEGCLPIPSVVWHTAGLRLHITAFVAGETATRALLARYVVENRSARASAARLFLAIRPFQVTPAWQALNLVSAIAPISRLDGRNARLRVNDAHDVVAVSAPDGVGTASSDEGLRALFEGRLPAAARVEDPLGFAEGAFAFDVSLAPHASEAIVIAVPLHDDPSHLPAGCARAAAAAWGAARLADATTQWQSRLARVPIELPPAAARITSSVRASLAWILVNRDGPCIQPGPRCYRRSWIRDGTITGTALAEMGFAEEARAFLRWYAPYQYADGRVPCAVDRHGADPVAEHDSHGQFVWGVVELSRLTGDTAFLRELWPRARRAVEAIATLRAERTGETFRGSPYFGLLPESISHEGYASRPVHSYWDDFFALRALDDAAEAAGWLAESETAEEIGVLRDAMRCDVHASLACVMAAHEIDFLPGSVELADFDPTSSASAFDPCGEAERLPRTALERTFERYWQEFEQRRRGEIQRDAYAPYELRNVIALLRLGWKERALTLLAWLLADQRPPSWCQWPEVAWRERRAPRFLGDLPHGWIASTFVRVVRRLLAYERAHDGALVVAAGVPEAWVRDAPGIRLRGLPTHFGPLDFTLHAEDESSARATFGPGLRRPPGGVVLVSPLARPLREIVVDGHVRRDVEPGSVRLADVPAEVVLRY